MAKAIDLKCPKCGFVSSSKDAAKVHQLYGHESSKEDRIEFQQELENDADNGVDEQ
jgi:phage FluMu protein Com